MKTPKNTVRAALVAAFPHTIPILAGFLFLGMTYGIYMRTLGAICGSLLHFNTEGLDFVMTAMFVVIFMEQWMKDKCKSFWGKPRTAGADFHHPCCFSP